jgi:TetR/AcrR family transcriptional regulator, regulator of biofilm formation and stress response
VRSDLSNVKDTPQVTDGRLRKGVERKARLIEAAMRIVGRDGIAALTQRGVAKEAELPPSAVTYHFDSIDDLLIASLREINDRYVHTLRRLPADQDAALDALAELIADSTDAHRLDVVGEFEVYLMATRRPDLRAELGRWVSALDALADRFFSDPIGRLSFVAAVEGMFFRTVTAERPVLKDDALRVLHRILSHS